MKCYKGHRTDDAVEVTVDGRLLNPRFDLRNHSQNGFEWGYCGSGPAQLALAVLADCLGDDNAALVAYQEFKRVDVANLPPDGWVMTEDHIRHTLDVIEHQRGLIMKFPSVAVSKFALGKFVATPNAIESLTHDDILYCLSRHAAGDWGNVDAHDRKENDLSLKQGLRLLSVYHSASGVKFWIITEADRSATTVLLPEDY